MATKKLLMAIVVGFFIFSTAGVAEAHRYYRRGRPSAGAVITAGALIGTIGLFRLISGSQTARVDEKAIEEEQRTRREQIRASAVLAAPSALGGSGNAGYHSSEGHANISANLGAPPTSSPRGRFATTQQHATPALRRQPNVDVKGFKSAGELLADKMDPEEFRAYGYALREVENFHHADHSRRTHREFVVPMLYELLFKLKGVGSPQQIAAWWSVIRYLEEVGGV